jgi:hypothetical protein
MAVHDLLNSVVRGGLCCWCQLDPADILLNMCQLDKLFSYANNCGEMNLMLLRENDGFLAQQMCMFLLCVAFKALHKQLSKYPCSCCKQLTAAPAYVVFFWRVQGNLLCTSVAACGLASCSAAAHRIGVL